MAELLCAACNNDKAVHHMIYHTSPLGKGDTFTGQYFGFSFCDDCWKKIEQFTRELNNVSC